MTDRLNSTDEMLMAASDTLGSARIVQVLWRFAGKVPGSALRAEWERLNQGRLSRRAVPSGVPGARRKWLWTANAEPLFEDPRPLSGNGVLDWIDRQVRVPLPVGSNALWRLASVPCQGGSLVSLTVPHFRADGIGVFAALDSRAPRAGHESGFGDDLAEAVGQTTRALTGMARWLPSLDRQRRARIAAALRTGRNGVTGSQPRFFVSAILDLDAREWQACAEAHGGTTNSLFVEIAANLVRGRVLCGDHINVGIPVNLRRTGTDDGRANALVVVPLAVPAGEPQHKDLTQTRRDTKVLLQRTGEGSGTLVPEGVWHLLPRPLATRLKPPGAQQTDVVASNFGDVPDGVVRFAGHRADSVALRTMNVPGLVPEKARLRASLCLVRVADRLTVTATGMPDQFGDAESFGRLVAGEFAAWGLRARRWC